MRKILVIVAVFIPLVFGILASEVENNWKEKAYARDKGIVVHEDSEKYRDKTVRAVNTNWAGYSTTTYDGNMAGSGGVKAANQICQANYAGSHWANVREITTLGSAYPWSTNAWINAYSAGYIPSGTSGNCVNWTSNSFSYSGSMASTQTFTTNACTASYYLPCVYGGVDTEL